MVLCYEVPVKCWYRVNKSQTLISRFLERCSKEEEALVHSYETPKPLSLTTICFYTDVNDLDLTGYFGNNAAGLSPRNNTGEWNIQTTDEYFSIGQKFAGFFFSNGSFNIVKSDSNTKIVIYSSESIQSEEVGNVLEKVVFSQLTDKCNFLQSLLEDFSAKSSFLQDDAHKPQNTEKRKIVDGLIGDIIALFNRSTIEKKHHPNVPGFEVKTIDEQIAKDLFKIDGSIKGVGYRFSKLYIDITEDDGIKEQNKRETVIKNYLTGLGILEYEICYVSPKETLFTYAGANCYANRDIGTLGCFACMTNNKGSSRKLCALVSGHFAIKAFDSDNTVFLDDRIPLGVVLRCTTTTKAKPTYDIAAVEVYPGARCIHSFLNSEKKRVPGRLHEAIISDDNYKHLQDKEVFIWGRSRASEGQPGFGKIFIPKYISASCPLPHVKVMDQYPYTRMASPGDSGGIICTDSLEDDKVILIAMLKGSTEDEQTFADNPCRKREYVTFMMRDGLKQLEQQTQYQFEIPSS